MAKERVFINAELPSGMRDYLPSEMITKQKVFDIIREVYENYGFVPLETPGVEKLEVLTGNDPNFNMNLFRTFVVRGPKNAELEEVDTDLALRFDLTVPLARFMAMHPELGKPFKRYQLAKVWRGEKAQAGRYREFSQFDADIIGTRSMLADTEIITVMYNVMRKIGFTNFVIKTNNRKILNGLAVCANFFEPQTKQEAVFRILDKLGKITEQEMVEELSKPPANQFDESKPELNKDDIDKIINFININGSGSSILTKAEKIIGQIPIGQQGISEMREIVENLTSIGIPEENWLIDLSVARGLGYYTGPVFETTLTDMPKIGSVYSGGRFDGLTNRFIPNSNIPGVGASVGVDRLFDAIDEMGLFVKQNTLTKVLVALFDDNLKITYLQLVNELRQRGINAEIYFDKEPLKAQLAYAAKKEIPYVIIIGSQEAENNTVTIRNMKTREQKTLDKNLVFDSILSEQ